MKAYNINRFLKVCLDIAEWVDDKSDADKNWFGGDMCHDIGLGCRALSGYLRSGVKSVMELQEKYHHANELRNFAESCKESMEEFLRDVFGDAEIYSINDKDKERIKEFVKGIMAEWDDRD